MTDEQAADLARQRDAEYAAQVPHNRRSITASIQNQRRRKQRRKANARLRGWTQDRQRQG